jgi:hypothetical protein
MLAGMPHLMLLDVVSLACSCFAVNGCYSLLFMANERQPAFALVKLSKSIRSLIAHHVR